MTARAALAERLRPLVCRAVGRVQVVVPRALGALVALLPPARRSARQVVAHAAAWTAHDREVLDARGEGPVWVVLGDSTAQGVGADAYDGGYVGGVLRLLEARDGVAWRVVNHSVSGARTADVVADQLPALRSTQERLGRADLVTAVVGGNDATHTGADRWRADTEELLAALPAGAVVATVARGWKEGKVRPHDAWLREAAPAAGLRVADLAAHTGPPYRGRYADGFHPNERGYEQWTVALAQALELPAPAPAHAGGEGAGGTAGRDGV